MRYLITGSHGFIGSNLAEELKKTDNVLYLIDLKVGGDVRFFDLPEVDVIFHLAAKASIPDSFSNPLEAHSHNVTATLRVLEHARKCGARVVLSSSSSVYGDAETPTGELVQKNPLSPYAAQKLICEEYLRLYWKLGVKSVALRYFNVFGEGQERANGGYSLALPIFLEQKKQGLPLTIIGDGEQTRDFVYVGDVVNANLKAAEWLTKADGFAAFNIGSGKETTINQLADVVDPKGTRVYLPPRPEPRALQADISSTKKYLKWKPTVTVKQWIKGLSQ